MRRKLGSTSGVSVAVLEGLAFNAESTSATLAVVVISDLDCTLQIMFVDDAGAETELYTAAVTGSSTVARSFVWPGNFGKVRPRLTRAAAVWAAQIYANGA